MRVSRSRPLLPLFLKPSRPVVLEHQKAAKLDLSVFCAAGVEDCAKAVARTLLQLCLNAHKGIYAGQELYLLMFDTLGERQKVLEGTDYAEGLLKTIMELRGCSAAANVIHLIG